MQESISDEALMQRYRDGDIPAFELLYARHKGPLYRYFARQIGPGAAEELFQDVWMNVIRARVRYRATAKFTTWFYRLAHNRLIDHYRRVRAALPVSYTDGDDGVIDNVPDTPLCEPDNALDRRRLAGHLLAALGDLPEAQREVFLLREESGLSLEEIAAITEVNVETAKSRLRYALDKLRTALAARVDETHRAQHGF